uniref:Uncharacterized protein n=1 Tax=Molossus molossus TaxID=27622 RepID=A0A7J8IZH5_MOLMO|nr:hypothetical protein HJG59_010422 [Molossus molossus]
MFQGRGAHPGSGPSGERWACPRAAVPTRGPALSGERWACSRGRGAQPGSGPSGERWACPRVAAPRQGQADEWGRPGRAVADWRAHGPAEEDSHHSAPTGGPGASGARSCDCCSRMEVPDVV